MPPLPVVLYARFDCEKGEEYCKYKCRFKKWGANKKAR